MSERVVAVERALDILLYLYYVEGEVGVSHLAKELGFNKSTTHRLLASLEEKGFVYQNQETERYSLGKKLYPIGLMAGEHESLLQLVKEPANELYKKWHEVVNVSILDFDPRIGYTSVVAYKIDTHNRVLSINPRVGSRFDAHLSSVGKCLLAFSPGVDLSFYKNYNFPQYTPSSITTYEGLLQEIEKVRKQGFAIDREEREIGLYCLGAPILRYGEAVAAISLSGPTSRLHDEREEERIASLKEIAEYIASGR